MRRGLRFAVISALGAWLAGCAVSTPMQWKDVASDVRVEISLTHAMLDPQKRTAFDAYTDQIRSQLGKQPGLVGHSVRRELFGNQVWTYTVWASAADRQAFVSTDLHLRAMQQAAHAIVDMRVRRFTVKRNEAPQSWREVLTWLDRQTSEDALDSAGP